MDPKKVMDLLIVEEDDVGAEAVTKLLEDRRRDGPTCRCSVRHERKLTSALDESCPAPDVVILDLGGGGPIQGATAERMSEKFRDAAVIVLTSCGNGDDRGDINLGAQDFLDKKELNRSSLWKSLNYAVSRKRLETAMRSDRENLDKANSILKVTSEISRNILDGSMGVEDIMATIGKSLGVDGVAVFCDRCLAECRPHCYWRGCGDRDISLPPKDCSGDRELGGEIAAFIRYNLPVSTRVMDAPESIRATVESLGFSGTSKVVAVPIMMDHEPWGLFCFYTLNGKTWSAAEMDALANLSRLCGSIIRNRRMEDEMAVGIQARFSEINKLINGGGS